GSPPRMASVIGSPSLPQPAFDGQVLGCSSSPLGVRISMSRPPLTADWLIGTPRRRHSDRSVVVVEGDMAVCALADLQSCSSTRGVRSSDREVPAEHVAGRLHLASLAPASAS